MTLKPEHIVEELNRTPKLKRDLIMKMMEVMLDSEAFLEAYPRLYDPALAEVSSEYREKVREELAQIIVRLFRKNKVRINGKPYSLPYMEPVTDITADKFADACFAKGEGWHCMTAAEWGLLACLSWKNGTLPHGNTNCGKYHADPTECGVNVKDSNKTLTGSGPATWTHDHTPTGVHDLCGNVLEIVRGLRIKDGALWAAENNNAALPETDLTTCGDGWKPIVDSNGDQVYVDAMDGIKFTTEKPQHGRANFESWEDVRMLCWSDQLMELGLFAGEGEAVCAVDATEGEYIPLRGGYWNNGGNAGLFYLSLISPRSDSGWIIGGRSAYFKKR